MDEGAKTKQDSIYYVGFVIITSLLVMLVILYSTTNGLGIFPDSVEYVVGANAINKLGLLEAYRQGILTRFPPVFPLLLSSLINGNGLAHEELRVPYIILAGANTMLLGYLLGICIVRKWLCCVLLLLGVGSPAYLRQHLILCSEPLFLMVLQCVLVVSFQNTDIKHNFASKLLYFLSALTLPLIRYAGIVFSALATFVPMRQDIRGRNSLILLWLLSLVPLIVWLVYIANISNSIGGREIIFYWPDISLVTNIIFALCSLLVPLSLIASEWLRMGLVILLPLLITIIASKLPQGRKLLIWILLYLLFLIVIRSTIDSAVPFNDRILLPLIPLLLLLIGLCFSAFSKKYYFSLMLLFSTNIFIDLPLIWQAREGMGFSNYALARSVLFTYINSLPADVHIYSNYPEPITLYSHRAGIITPKDMDSNSRKLNVNLKSDIDDLDFHMRHDAGVIIWFKSFRWRTYLVPIERLQQEIKIEKIKSFDFADVFQVKSE